MENISIVVGNSTYSHASRLDCCDADTQIISELLEATKKFSVIKLFNDLTSSELKDQLREFLGAFSEIDELFFYFTGHGYQGQDDFFFCCTDFQQSRPNETGMSLTDLHDLFRAANTNLVVKVIDSCHSGTLLLKSDGSFMPVPKDGFSGHIQIASCLDDQSSLTGDPLSQFTQHFVEAAISKTDSAVYYTDIINSLRDRFLNNPHQTPHFVSQGTGREIFADSGEKFSSIRQKIFANQSDTSELALPQQLTDHEEISPFERLRELEHQFVEKEKAQEFTAAFGKAIEDAVRKMAEGYVDGYEIDTFVHDDYHETDTRDFIVRVLHKEERPDNFVTTHITREIGNRPFGGINSSLSLFAASVTPGTNVLQKIFELDLNCSFEKVQIKISLTPTVQSLRKWSLIMSFAPSLNTCYVFEYLMSHELSDWGKYDGGGVEAKRRWYRFAWGDDFDAVVSKITANLGEHIDDDIASAINRFPGDSDT